MAAARSLTISGTNPSQSMPTKSTTCVIPKPNTPMRVNSEISFEGLSCSDLVANTKRMLKKKVVMTPAKKLITDEKNQEIEKTRIQNEKIAMSTTKAMKEIIK